MSIITGFTSRLGTEVPSYLFTSPDASLHVFDFLSDPNFGAAFNGDGISEGRVSNWTNYCGINVNVALGYGPFVGCLLYPNVTRHVRDGTLPANLTDIGFAVPGNINTENLLSRSLQSHIPTCLVSYCASQPDCASTFACNVGNLLTSNGNLSAQGVANCWQTLCSLNVQALDADIAGIGVSLTCFQSIRSCNLLIFAAGS
jgi:hypothetical protein